MSTSKNFELLESLDFGVIEGKPVPCDKANCSKCLFRPFVNNKYKGSSIEKRRQWLKEQQKKELFQKCYYGEIVLIEGLEKRGLSKDRNGLYVFGYCTLDGVHYFYKNPLCAQSKGSIQPDLALRNKDFDVENLTIAGFEDIPSNTKSSIKYTVLTMR